MMHGRGKSDEAIVAVKPANGVMAQMGASKTIICDGRHCGTDRSPVTRTSVTNGECVMTSAITDAPTKPSSLAGEKTRIDEEQRDDKRNAASVNYSFVEMLFDVLLFIP
jgi:hypothetical protein